ncbi:MAG: KGK domain-containing protein [Cyanobacteria bacterium P01_D01_bin.116]
MEKQFERLERNEVISVSAENSGNLEISSTFKVLELLEVIQKYISFQIPETSLFDEGIDCEILKLGARGWKKGKVRICVEFSPEEPEYPLEDLAELLE